MKRWRILLFGTTEVLVHPAVLVYLLYAGATGHLTFTLTAFCSIMLHEAAHGVMSFCLGQKPSCIEVTPLGAVMRLEDEAQLPPWKRLLVVLAGPMMSLLLCWAALLSTGDLFPAHTGRMIFLANLAILLMNLLPVLPLDGGRILMILLESILPRKITAKIMQIISMIIGIGLVVLNVWYSWRFGGWNLSLAFSGCCILYSASMFLVTRAKSELRYFLDRKIWLERKGSVPTVCCTALHTVPVYKLIKRLPAKKMLMCICTEVGTGCVLGCIHESVLIQLYLETPSASLHQALKQQNKSYEFAKSDTI